MVSVIAKSLRDRRIHKALTDIFDKADIDKSGKLNVSEYLELCRNYNIEVTDEDLRSIELLAENNGGGLSKTDFILFVRQTNRVDQFDTVDPESDHHWNEKIKQAWKMFDRNGDGKLSQLEFRWMTDKKNLSDKSIQLMWSKCDLDKDGYLDFEEFQEMILRARARKELKSLEDQQQLDIMNDDIADDENKNGEREQPDLDNSEIEEDIVEVQPVPVNSNISTDEDIQEEIENEISQITEKVHFKFMKIAFHSIF